MGKSIVHCGGAGNGQVAKRKRRLAPSLHAPQSVAEPTHGVRPRQVAKLCNNLLLGITMAGVSEAFNLGQ
jgi:3-hydroxyisobutyrate dehydrogenase-like beta-hydroxyacid dehydrogenase